MRLIILTWIVMLSGLAAGIALTGLPVGRLPTEGRLLADEIPQLSLAGYLQAEVAIDANNIVLTSGCRRLSMATHDYQAESISRGLEDSRDARPNAHDIMVDILDTYDMDVLMVKVESFSGDAYFSKLVIQQGDRVLNLDAKPSDSIAVAVRKGAPVYVSQQLLGQLGKNVC
ncbi:MAG: bifunctional nuclease family protein [Candidatus Aenigmarchaeota archaeon]|nr:bifunctional nuclease family protein [Candidatus Aenigmarchaeota archaeon]